MSTIIAAIKYLYLYPVKSMRGVAVNEAHVGLNGIYGDRRYTFVQQRLAASDGFPWMTGREKPRLILYAPRFELTTMPIGKGWDEARVMVRTPDGEEFDVEDPHLSDQLSREAGTPLLLLKSSRGNYDSQHLSLFSLASLRDLEFESGSAIDYRQFRANIYLEPANGEPFAEEEWLGKILRIGASAIVGVTKKDTRCMMINLNPESAVQNPKVLRTVTQLHDQQIGIYANVIAPGMIRVGDEIRLA
jgi:uncharacterized protein YcbX